jgi:site-specific recombinase XerD
MAIRLEDLLASFRRHLRAAAKAPRTIELYSQSVRYFSRWLTDRDREPVLDELTRHAIAAWLAELAETAEPATVATRLRGMRRFCRWLVTEGELEKAPTDGIEIASSPDKPVPILSDEEIAALLKTCAVPRGRPGVFERTVFLGRRDEVVLRLLLMQGAETWAPLPATMDALAGALPRVDRAVLLGQSHFATDTAPQLFADTLRRFLRDHQSPMTATP